LSEICTAWSPEPVLSVAVPAQDAGNVAARKTWPEREVVTVELGAVESGVSVNEFVTLFPAASKTVIVFEPESLAPFATEYVFV
jgi:hypothetical protein